MERKPDELRKEIQPEGTEEDEDMVPMESVGMMEATAEFDEMIVWSHEAIATAAEDPYVRSVEEWLQLAEKVGYIRSGVSAGAYNVQVNSYESDDSKPST